MIRVKNIFPASSYLIKKFLFIYKIEEKERNMVADIIIFNLITWNKLAMLGYLDKDIFRIFIALTLKLTYKLKN
jgi:hypothetical protein